MKVLFRTDASLEIGTGHVMRCLTLADALRLRGNECLFVCRAHASHLGELIGQRGHRVQLLPVEPDQVRPLDPADQPFHLAWLGSAWERDAEQTAELARAEGVDLLVVDHYALDARWEGMLRPWCKQILAIDDLADRPHDCDFLLDQNLIQDMQGRYANRVPDSCIQILGPNFALLQPRYAELHDRLPLRAGPIRRVLIYFGGADADNLTGMAIAACLSLPEHSVDIDVVANPRGPHIDALREQIRAFSHITLHESLPSLAALIARADLAIGASGATSWERCCLGVPSLVISLAENQRPIAAELNCQGLIRWVGHKGEIDQADLERALADVFENGLNPAWSERCSRLVDGKGVSRVCGILSLEAASDILVRPAKRSDEAGLAADALAAFRHASRDVANSCIYVAETPAGVSLGTVLFRCLDGRWHIAPSFSKITIRTNLQDAVLQAALRNLRAETDDVLVFESEWRGDALVGLVPAFSDQAGKSSLSITICSDKSSWLNDAIPALLMSWLSAGHTVSWAHSAEDAPASDLCFYLSYGRIVGRDVRARHAHNLVVHESDLPKGRGWAPMSWQILEGASDISVTLLEAADDVDAGAIYLQDQIQLGGYELNAEWRAMQAETTFKLCRQFVEHYPAALLQARVQVGEASSYPRRRAEDSRLDPARSIAEQFDLLRIVNNEDYPAFFELDGRRFVLRIEKSETA